MIYDSKPFPDDDLLTQISEEGITRTLFPRLTTAPSPRRPEPSGIWGRALAAPLEHSHEDVASSDAVVAHAVLRDPEFDLISDAQFASDMVGARLVAESNAKAIVFIDAGVTDINAIVRAASMDAEIVMLDAKSDGIRQIAGHLQSRAGIQKMHIVSHGAPGELQLGDATLSMSSITGAHRDELATIGSALAPDAYIIVCGGDVSASVPGKDFVQALAAVAGANVYGSDDPAGASIPGGNRNNDIRQRVNGAFTNVVPDWTRLLAPPVTGNDGLATVTTGGTSGGHRRMA